MVFTGLSTLITAPDAVASPVAVPPAAASAAATVPVCPPAAAGRMTCFSVRQVNPAEPANVNRRLSPASAATTLPTGYGPADLASAYKLDATKGAGQTVAIVDAGGSPTVEADLATYRATYGLPACTTANGCFQQVNQAGAASPLPAALPGWQAEIALDVDMVSATCPLCHILLVSTDQDAGWSLAAGVDQAVALGAKFVSNSYGFSSDAPDATAFDGDYNHPGVAITVATGDSGYGATYPAVSKYVTAVGGTTLTPDSASARGWDEAAWGQAGSGCSPNNAQPAFQASVGTGCSTRASADVSAVALNLAVYTNGAWGVYGGTSASTPIIASVYALAGTPWTSDYPNSYPYAHASSLFDITSGNNGTCPTTQWCTAGAGWDGPTGLGTPNGSAAFALPGRAPVLNDLSTTPLNPTAEKVLGHANTFGDSSVKAVFQWGTTTSYSQSQAAIYLSSGFNAPFTTSFTGLTTKLTYHYRVVLYGPSGTLIGPDKTFVAGAPGITSAVEISPGPGQATFLVQATTLTPSLTATVKWGTTTAYGSTLSKALATSSTGALYNFAALWTSAATGLTPGATYHYSYTLYDTNGSTTSGDLTFIAAGAPVITSATGTSPRGGTANFSVSANTYTDSAATATLNWGPTSAYGSALTKPMNVSPGTNGYTATSSLFDAVTGLTPYATYHYSYTVNTAHGTVTLPDQTFVVQEAPLITAGYEFSPAIGTANFQVQAVTYTEPTATAVVEWGTTTAYGSSLSQTMTATASNGIYAGVTTWKNITGLTPGVTYHYTFTVTTAGGSTIPYTDQTFVARSS
ncbi:hypothetical protein SAMN05444157_1345 [Frankineae bacterium MT45]|nr:hypothetical protein SAMN05444157_1345 [Frankineae bacterium MT45]